METIANVLNRDHLPLPREPLTPRDLQSAPSAAQASPARKYPTAPEPRKQDKDSSFVIGNEIAPTVHVSDGLNLDTNENSRSKINGYTAQDAVSAFPEDGPDGHPRKGVDGRDTKPDRLEILRPSPEKVQDLTITPRSLAVRPADAQVTPLDPNNEPSPHTLLPLSGGNVPEPVGEDVFPATPDVEPLALGPAIEVEAKRPRNLTIETGNRTTQSMTSPSLRPGLAQRALSTPGSVRSPLSPQKQDRIGSRPTLKIPESGAKVDSTGGRRHSSSGRPLPSPMPTSIPLPPLSIPTYLQLELSSQRPSQLYIHRSANSDFPYESSRVKIERLTNFLLLPFHLEQVLWFGTLACVDAWLYTFTILPLRLLKSFYILAKSWCSNFISEAQFVSNFIYNGSGRMWRRRRRSSVVPLSTRKASGSDAAAENKATQATPTPPRRSGRHHQRTKSVPSALLPDDKADMLKGLLIICTCLILLRLDASRMYHWIRGQAAIKLYVIYNLLEVCDRLFSAIGQDVLECLFSKEALERKPDGHSKVLRPLWLFLLALTYTVIHSTALFYQVITLNVAVNSYSNALITLLMSNQFVEIKSTVFKKFEKENLFQLTCADVVERFQLWHMLVIIASRNIVETGGLSAGLTALTRATTATASPPLITNSSLPLTTALPPRSVSSILPKAFTLVPTAVSTITSYAPAVSQILGPFLAVLGSEMLVDWLKHAYIGKFNNTRPAIYERFLDVLAKDYYTNAFGDQNLTKRLGLPVIPLSCLLIRASVQTYQMFMAAWVPSTPASSSTSLASIHEHYSAARSTMPMTTSTAISKTVDDIIRAIPAAITNSSLVSHMTTILLFLLFFLVLLACKLVLSMLLLALARNRYRSMKMRERTSIYHVDGGRRVGGWGVVEVDDDQRRWIYEDDAAGYKGVKEREEKDKNRKEKGNGVEAFEKVKRYEMVAKRIW